MRADRGEVGVKVVVKVGTSSLTDAAGVIDVSAIDRICAEIATVRALGHRLVLVSSGAIAAGLPIMGLGEGCRPRDTAVLQAVSAVGQIRLMSNYERSLAAHDLIAAQVLLSPYDFVVRQQYLHARATLGHLLELGAVPVVNENDAVANDEIRFGDNDRIAALVAQLVGADLLVLLTDTAGVLTADPRLDADASLIEEIHTVDQHLERVAGGAGSERGSGGMTTKLAAAKIASWCGVRTVIAAADRARVVVDAIDGRPGVGTVVLPRPTRLAARKVWIAFAVGSQGTIQVDAGAERAVRDRNTSLLGAGVVGADGSFDAQDAVEIVGPDGQPFAKGLVRVSASEAVGFPGVVVHRDDLLVFPT